MSILYRNDKLDKVDNQKIGENIFHAGDASIVVKQRVIDPQTHAVVVQDVTLSLKDVYEETSEGVFYEPSTNLRGVKDISSMHIYDPADFASIAPTFQEGEFYVDVTSSAEFNKKEFTYNNTSGYFEFEGTPLDLTTVGYLVYKVNQNTYRFYNLKQALPLDMIMAYATAGSSTVIVPIPPASAITSINTIAFESQFRLTNDPAETVSYNFTLSHRPLASVQTSGTNPYYNSGFTMINDHVILCGSVTIDIKKLQFSLTNSNSPYVVKFENNTPVYYNKNTNTTKTYFECAGEYWIEESDGYRHPMNGALIDFDEFYRAGSFNNKLVTYNNREEITRSLKSAFVISDCDTSHATVPNACMNGQFISLHGTFVWDTDHYYLEEEDINGDTSRVVYMKKGIFYFNFIPYAYDFFEDNFYIPVSNEFYNGEAFLYPQFDTSTSDADILTALTGASRVSFTKDSVGWKDSNNNYLDLSKDFAFINPLSDPTAVYRLNLSTGDGIKLALNGYDLGLKNTANPYYLKLGEAIADSNATWTFNSTSGLYELSFTKILDRNTDRPIENCITYKNENLTVNFYLIFDPRYYSISVFIKYPIASILETVDPLVDVKNTTFYMGTLFLDLYMHYADPYSTLAISQIYDSNSENDFDRRKVISDTAGGIFDDQNARVSRCFTSFLNNRNLVIASSNPLESITNITGDLGNIQFNYEGHSVCESTYNANHDVGEAYNGSPEYPTSSTEIQYDTNYQFIISESVLTLQRAYLGYAKIGNVAYFKTYPSNMAELYYFPRSYSYPHAVSLYNVFTIDTVNNSVDINVTNLLNNVPDAKIYSGLLDAIINLVQRNYYGLGLSTLSEISLSGITSQMITEAADIRYKFLATNANGSFNDNITIKINGTALPEFTSGLDIMGIGCYKNFVIDQLNPNVESVDGRVILNKLTPKIAKILISHSTNPQLVDLSAKSVGSNDILDFAFAGNTQYYTWNNEQDVISGYPTSVVIKFADIKTIPNINTLSFAFQKAALGGSGTGIINKNKQSVGVYPGRSENTAYMSLTNLHLENVNYINFDVLFTTGRGICNDLLGQEHIYEAKTYLKGGNTDKKITFICDDKFDMPNMFYRATYDSTIVFDNVTKITAAKVPTQNPLSQYSFNYNKSDIYIPASVTHLGGELDSALTTAGFVSYCPFYYYNDVLTQDFAVIHFGGTETQWNNIVFDSDWLWLKSYPYVVFEDPGDSTLVTFGTETQHVQPSPRFVPFEVQVSDPTLFLNTVNHKKELVYDAQYDTWKVSYNQANVNLSDYGLIEYGDHNHGDTLVLSVNNNTPSVVAHLNTYADLIYDENTLLNYVNNKSSTCFSLDYDETNGVWKNNSTDVDLLEDVGLTVKNISPTDGDYIIIRSSSTSPSTIDNIAINYINGTKNICIKGSSSIKNTVNIPTDIINKITNAVNAVVSKLCYIKDSAFAKFSSITTLEDNGWYRTITESNTDYWLTEIADYEFSYTALRSASSGNLASFINVNTSKIGEYALAYITQSASVNINLGMSHGVYVSSYAFAHSTVFSTFSINEYTVLYHNALSYAGTDLTFNLYIEANIFEDALANSDIGNLYIKKLNSTTGSKTLTLDLGNSSVDVINSYCDDLTLQLETTGSTPSIGKITKNIASYKLILIGTKIKNLNYLKCNTYDMGSTDMRSIFVNNSSTLNIQVDNLVLRRSSVSAFNVAGGTIEINTLDVPSNASIPFLLSNTLTANLTLRINNLKYNGTTTSDYVYLYSNSFTTGAAGITLNLYGKGYDLDNTGCITIQHSDFHLNTYVSTSDCAVLYLREANAILFNGAFGKSSTVDFALKAYSQSDQLFNACERSLSKIRLRFKDTYSSYSLAGIDYNSSWTNFPDIYLYFKNSGVTVSNPNNIPAAKLHQSTWSPS